MNAPLVIIGSGLAAYTLAREWRKLDAHSPLLIISRDDAGFYSKPMLSNALAAGKTPQSLVMKSAEQMALDLKAEILSHHEVQSIDEVPVRPYGRLVLALGADPIRLPLAGDAADRVHAVNDLQDFERFIHGLQGARQVAILGAGLIGCEFANDLLARGIKPTVIDPAPAPLGRLLPPEAGAYLKQRLQAAGIEFIQGASVEQVNASPNGQLALTLTDGSRLLSDNVLSAVGLRPRTALAQRAGVLTRRGVLVDRLLRTSAPNIHALGDCIELQHEGQGHVLPFVMPLMQQARALAATLAGTPTPVVYPAMPVTVKTPACPTVVCPPPATAAVRWETESDSRGCASLARSADGTLQGFALLGAATSRKQELVREVAALVA